MARHIERAENTARLSRHLPHVACRRRRQLGLAAEPWAAADHRLAIAFYGAFAAFRESLRQLI
jgi:uncharacterized alpha-E superfamily protein